MTISNRVSKKTFLTKDGVNLSYLEAGQGRPLLMLPAWSQAAEEFKFQLEGLSDRYRVIALDFRGHGDSAKPSYGYRISRLAMDVREFIDALELEGVIILGHSMGNSVIWCYWDLFGPDRLSKVIIVDEPPFIVANPIWSPGERETAGALWDAPATTALANRLANSDGPDHREEFTGNMLTGKITPEQKAWILRCTMRMPRELGATLLYNHAHQDWRDVIPRITLPTLVIAGRVSNVPWKSQVWISEQIKGSRLRVFEEDEGGAHFMFIEAPELFNSVVSDFVESQDGLLKAGELASRPSSTTAAKPNNQWRKQ